MSAAAAGVRIPRDPASSPFRPEGAAVTVGQTFTKGWMLMRDGTTGLAQVATEVPGLLPGGFVDKDQVLASVSGDFVNMETGIYSVDMSALAGDAFTDTSPVAPIYAINNNDFGKLPVNPSTGALRSIAGCFLRLDRPLTGSKCFAWLGPQGVALALGAAASSATVVPTYRAVITTIAAYTGTLTGTLTASANGAIGAQDTGVTLLAGDRVFLPVITGGAGGATVAADSGPYLVVSPGAGGSKFVLTRPPEYQHGGLIPEDFTLKIGEGTIWAGNEWRAFPASAALVIDTGDPVFWPRTYSADLTVAGANTTFWLRDVKRIAGVDITGANAWWASTLTAGAGNGAVTISGTGGQHVYFTAINF